MAEQKPLLDERVFRRYVSTGDEQLRRRIVGLFEDQVERYIADFETALDTADVQLLGSELHKMKGTTSFIGASYLHALVCEVMQEPGDRRLIRLDSILGDLKTGLRETVDAMLVTCY